MCPLAAYTPLLPSTPLLADTDEKKRIETMRFWSVVPGVRIELTTKRYECLVLPLELTGH